MLSCIAIQSSWPPANYCNLHINNKDIYCVRAMTFSSYSGSSRDQLQQFRCAAWLPPATRAWRGGDTAGGRGRGEAATGWPGSKYNHVASSKAHPCQLSVSIAGQHLTEPPRVAFGRRVPPVHVRQVRVHRPATWWPRAEHGAEMQLAA